MRAVAPRLTRVHLQLPVGSFGADYSAGKGRAQVAQLLDKAAGDGMNFVRMWAFTVTCAALCPASCSADCKTQPAVSVAACSVDL